MFGLEPNYGCCTANFNQGWPKLALSAFMYHDDTVFASIPIPCTLNAENVTVSLKTNYPFENNWVYGVKAKKDIKLKIRVPSFAQNLRVNGEKMPYCEELTFPVSADESQRIEICFDTLPALIDRPHNLKSVKCGSLIFSIPIKYEKKMREYEKDGVERKFPYCDYEYIPQSDWNYAYSSPFFKSEVRQISDIPFISENPPVVVKAEVKQIPWGFEPGYTTVCAKTPQSRIPLSEAKIIELYPYGCAKLRMTEIPLI